MLKMYCTTPVENSHMSRGAFIASLIFVCMHAVYLEPRDHGCRKRIMSFYLKNSSYISGEELVGMREEEHREAML